MHADPRVRVLQSRLNGLPPGQGTANAPTFLPPNRRLDLLDLFGGEGTGCRLAMGQSRVLRWFQGGSASSRFAGMGSTAGGGVDGTHCNLHSFFLSLLCSAMRDHYDGSSKVAVQ